MYLIQLEILHCSNIPLETYYFNIYKFFDNSWINIKELDIFIDKIEDFRPSCIDDIFTIKWINRTALINNVKVKMDFYIIWDSGPNSYNRGWHQNGTEFHIYYGGGSKPLSESYRRVNRYHFYKQKTTFAFENILAPNYMKLRNDVVFNKITYSSDEIIYILRNEFLYDVVFKVKYYSDIKKTEETIFTSISHVQFDEIYNINEGNIISSCNDEYINIDSLISIDFERVDSAYILNIIREGDIVYFKIIYIPIYLLTTDCNLNAAKFLIWYEGIFSNEQVSDELKMYLFDSAWKRI